MTSIKPEGLSRSEEEERAYRRGFDQGLYSGLRLGGLTDKEVQSLALKTTIAEWRKGRRSLIHPMEYLERYYPRSPKGWSFWDGYGTGTESWSIPKDHPA